MSVSIECCYERGIKPDRWCNKHCPVRWEAQNNAEKKWPYVGTGLGNMYGPVPEHNISDEALKLINKSPNGEAAHSEKWELGDSPGCGE